MTFRPIAFALLVACTPAAFAQTAEDPARRVDALFSSMAGEKPGCAVGVTQNGQKIVEKAFGLADLERNVPNTTTTVFEIGSVSKQFTAAAVLLLERDGKLKLTDDIRKYLPEMPAYDAPITIEMLLNHTSGLRDWGSIANAMGKPRGERNFSNAEVLDIAARQKHLNYKPGAEYSYTNTGYNLAAIIVERVSGKSFMDFTRERLFEPLGMKTAQWRDDFNRIVKNRAMAYVPSGGGYEQAMPFMNVYGNGGLMMTIADFTLWNEAMMADKLGLRAAMEKKSALSDGREIPYARGVNVMPMNGVTEVSHSGATGGYTAWLARYPDRKLSVALLCNAPPSGVSPQQLTNIFIGASPEAQTAAGLPDPAAYAGSFVNTRTGYLMSFAAADGQLQYGGRAMPRVSETRWRRGPDTYTFLSNDRLQVETIDGNRFEYARTPSITTLTAAQLGEYAGAYSSDETRATYRVALEGDRLMARIDNWPDTNIRLSPIYKDAFMGGGVLVRFRRDASGRINALSLGDGRMRDLNAPRVK